MVRSPVFPGRRGTQAWDPDRDVTTRAVRDIAVETAVFSACMVIAGAVLLFLGLWVEATRSNRRDPLSGALLVRLDPDDIAGLVLIVTVGVVVMAGAGTLVLARRAIRPLEESMRRERAFVADASHELRTPLAVASARAQQLVMVTRGTDDAGSVARDLHADIAILADIVDDMLASVADDRRPETTSDLGEVLTGVTSDLRTIAGNRVIEVDLAKSFPGGTIVAVPSVELRRALTAVIDNALSYAPVGSTVRVRARRGARFWEVRVSDEGPGIIGIAPDRVFERFAHGSQPPPDARRSSHGIGLALAHDLLAARGGAIRVESTGPHGTTFLLRLPTEQIGDHRDATTGGSDGH